MRTCTDTSVSCAKRFARGRGSLQFTAIVVVGALAALLLAATYGCRSTAKTPATTAGSSPRTSTTSAEVDESPKIGNSGDYRAVGERNLFRPLVTAPKSAEAGAAGGAGETKSGKAATKTGTPGSGAQHPTHSGPPDPTTDLALTGIIETTDGLRALVEQISTRKGDFVAVGDVAFGLAVKAIRADAVTLAQGQKTYDLRLGGKELLSTSPMPAASSSGQPQGPSSPSSASSSSPSPMGGLPAGMPDFRSMSSDQRRDAYRNWWDGMSEDQRQQFRSRRGGFGGGGGGGGFGGGRGGGPPGQ